MSKNRRRRTARLRAEAAGDRAAPAGGSRPQPGRPAACAIPDPLRVGRTRPGGRAWRHGGSSRAWSETVGLACEIDASVGLLKVHVSDHESDHVLNIAYNALCGGRRLEDIETRRSDAVFLDGLGTPSLPDPTTADFCRRFDEASIMALQEAINRARLKVWSRQPAAFFSQTARIDVDASIIGTDAQCKQGMDIAYNGIWGYSALVVSLANTAEPLYQSLHGANRPSHEGVIPLYDRSIKLCRQAGFSDILLRGDTDFATTEFDRWDADGCASCSAMTPRPTSSKPPRAKRRISTTSWRGRPNARSRRGPGRVPQTSRTTSCASAAIRRSDRRRQRRDRVLLPARQLREGLPRGGVAEEPDGERGDNVLFGEYRS